ncbi:hypothetical protein [Pseudomonas sp. BF-R-01]|uniref:hypothetical protein n=1 Tax=Pseudomonas sp. BF-R-01 TaxID=2832365 RepID=UPI001CBBD148|nr:hypothetical protein [Pseudomonas sp. BF-R-01]
MLNALFRHERALWALAIEHFGDSLVMVLQGYFDRAQALDPDQHYQWRYVPPSPMVEALQHVYLPGAVEPVGCRQRRSPQAELLGWPAHELHWLLLDEHRVFLFHQLTQALPIERLPPGLTELRLELDLGV